MVVSWDENKNDINKKKHGVSFETASLVFSDEQRIELYDEKHSDDEDRYIVIGNIGVVLVVVYTMRNNMYRIISARKATAGERRYYEEVCYGS